ncbi:MAG: DUF4345 family protein [Myxococcota bacterium]
MESTLLTAAACICVPLFALGLRSMLAPTRMAESMSIVPRGAAGLNTVRGVMGGFFLACVAMLSAGLVTGNSTWFLAVAALMGAVVVGRAVGILLDGFDKSVIPPLVVEVVIGGVLIAASLVGKSG